MNAKALKNQYCLIKLNFIMICTKNVLYLVYEVHVVVSCYFANVLFKMFFRGQQNLKSF